MLPVPPLPPKGGAEGGTGKNIEKDSLRQVEAGEERMKETNLELKTIIKQLERDNIVLRSQIKPIVAYNKETKSFEYIGEPCSLKEDGSSWLNIDEILELSKKWIKINNRLTVSSIFNSFDTNKSGYLDKEQLQLIFCRLGIQLHKNEVQILFNWLKDEEGNSWRYRPLVSELTTGPCQIEFIPVFFIEISKLVLKYDYDRNTFINEINKSKANSISDEELYKGFDDLFQQDVNQDTVYDIWSYYENSGERKLDPEKLTNKVYDGCLAITIRTIKNIIEEKQREYARDAREGKLEETKGLSLDNEFSKIDREHDGFVTFEQFK